ncbi:unnamed protein product [Nippostrongylus brasiliensis]|uniref:Clc-like protein n=1 Tax=Nippostrongylus brasiliensis TaxID=27835 RepID=A0A0N4Y7N7_NIPBR|nr:unnamed protein product [Nippostrongylus brasiliensis]
MKFEKVVVERPKQAEIHRHGLWWDCVVSDGTLIPLSNSDAQQRAGEKCYSKFDPAVQSHLRNILEAGESSSREVLLHRFLPHHKAVIFFSVFTFVFGAIGVITGACSPCFPPNSLLYVVSIFMTGSCSVLSDVIFVFGVTKDERTRAGADEEPQEASEQVRLGMACYVHMMASSFFLLALIFSIVSSYLLISSNKGREGCCTSKADYVRQYRWQQDARMVFACSKKSCRPIVIGKAHSNCLNK